MTRFLSKINSFRIYIFAALIFFFLFISYIPTFYELSNATNLADKNREFILEHNYYWPDYNLYLSKVRQGWEGRWTALERYTSEPHKGSLIQEFYVILGKIGKTVGLDPTFSYQLGRFILSPLLLLVILTLVNVYFKETLWQITAFIIVLVSGSFPRFYTDNAGIHVGRFMEWWSNIDALQRITFIPHIIFGQVGSFIILYLLLLHPQKLTKYRLIGLIILGNLVGLAFPPSLITLNSVIILNLIVNVMPNLPAGRHGLFRHLSAIKILNQVQDNKVLFFIFTIPSLLYIFLITKISPWSALVDFHRTHPMMIPFGEYILGTGPILFLGLFGSVLAVIKKDKIWQPLIFWIISTFSFAVLFSHIKEQSPLRFTQTGLFIPLGLLGGYFLYHLKQLLGPKIIFILISLYIVANIFMINVGLDWQMTFIRQRVGADVPPVPYPPQTMYPLKKWMDGIRWLSIYTKPDDVILTEITAGNFIPAYAGNTVYFGQSNTINYDQKQLLVDSFFQGQLSIDIAKIFLRNGKIKYIFFSVQEKNTAFGNELTFYYPFLTPVFQNSLVTIYRY